MRCTGHFLVKGDFCRSRTDQSSPHSWHIRTNCVISASVKAWSVVRLLNFDLNYTWSKLITKGGEKLFHGTDKRSTRPKLVIQVHVVRQHHRTIHVLFSITHQR